MNHYLVTLNLRLGSVEKTARALIEAKTADEDGTSALIGECHEEPDFSDYPDKQSCWDMGEFVYEVYSVKLIEPEELPVLHKYIGSW